MSEISSTFLAALRSVGTACTMAGAGVYMHRRNFVTPEGKRMFALLSQQVTIPIFLFTKIVFCNQDWSSEPCPNVTDSLSELWMLFFWPAWVVGCGFAVGAVIAIVSGTPRHQRRCVLAACAFGNSTGLPITLLTVVHANFPANTELGRIDPTLFLSIYLLLYPVLQWGLGGWLLAPGDEDDGETSGTSPLRKRRNSSLRNSSIHSSVRHVLNAESLRMQTTENGLDDCEATMQHIDSNVSDFSELPTNYIGPPLNVTPIVSRRNMQHIGESDYFHGSLDGSSEEGNEKENGNENARDMAHEEANGDGVRGAENYAHEKTPLVSPEKESGRNYVTGMETICIVLSKCLQPPVVGALMGMVVAAITPVRGIFVDLVDRTGDALLQWFFDGLYEIGKAAVPINMIILGINLSASASKKAGRNGSNMLSSKTKAAIVVGKMVVMPIVGIASTAFFATYFWNISPDIDAAVYLVTMIVFITPTANNVMIMVELSGGSGMKQGIAQAIGWQYAVAPVLLSFSVAAVVGVASGWLDSGHASSHSWHTP